MKGLIAGLSALVVMLALLVAKYEIPGPAVGSAPPGIEASLASSSIITVSTTVVTEIFQTSIGCASRSISTAERPIRFVTGSTSPTQDGTIGHFQAASSTISYDAGVWGCGNWNALSIGVGSVITRDEFR